MKRLVICIIASVLLIVAVAIGMLYSLTTSDMQMWILNHSLEALSEKLQTRVTADSVGVDVKRGRLFLYGFEMDDRKNVTMLKVDTLEAKMLLTELVNNRAVINDVMLHGVEANLYKERRDSAANYQFVLDTFKKEKSKKKAKKNNADKMSVVLDAAELNRLKVRWNTNIFTLASMKYNGKNHNVKLAGIHIVTNNKKTRKNVLKPHRGAFDPGHLNTFINLDVTLHELTKKRVSLTINDMDAKDKENGLDLRKLTAGMDMVGDSINISNLNITFGKATHLTFESLKATYSITPASKDGKKKKTNVDISPSRMTARVDLRDISTAFAPALSHFSTPLTLDVTVQGNLDRICFNNIKIKSLDNRLQLKASGDLCKMLEKEKLCLHFPNIHLNARNGIKEQIVNHFAKKMKLKMMRQLKAIGDVTFDGSLGIYYKRENIDGCLHTQFGNVNVDFVINGNTKYMTGSMNSDSLEIGKIMNIQKLGPIKAQATYSFDTASNKKNKRNGKHHGRLPIGWLKAEVDNARFRMIHFKQITAEMESDGSTAQGTLRIPQKIFDVVTKFEYTQTDAEQSIKVKPSITRHRKDEDSVQKK